MLPTSGYFRGVPCPGQEDGRCDRPYCHFRHHRKERSSASSTQPVVPSPAPGAAGVEEGSRNQEEVVPPDEPQDLPECSRATGTTTTTATAATTSEPEEPTSHQQQQQQQQQQPNEPPEQPSGPSEVPKSDILHQLVNEALKKVLAENPALASTVDASAIRIGIDPLVHESSELSKAKKQCYLRPPDTPSYNPTPITELKKRKLSVETDSDLSYKPKGAAFVSGTEEKESEDKESDEGELGEFSSDDSEETEEKTDDFDLLEEVLAEHSKNNKVKIKKKRVKQLGKLKYNLSNTDKKVDNTCMITDARKLAEKETKRHDTLRTDSSNKVSTEGSYFLPPSPIFTSSSDGFEVYNTMSNKPNTAYQEEEEEKKEGHDQGKCSEKAASYSKPIEANTQVSSEKIATKTKAQGHEPATTPSQPANEKKTTKAKGHAHLPQLLSTRDTPKMLRPHIRSWTPQVKTPSSDSQTNPDQLDELLQMMDGKNTTSKRKLSESECPSPAEGGQKAGSMQPRKKYKVDLNKEIESLTGTAPAQSEEAATSNTQQEEEAATPRSPDGITGKAKEADAPEKSRLEPEEEEEAEEKASDAKDRKKSTESDADVTESEDSDNDSEDSEYQRSRKKRKKKRERSSSSSSDYSRHRKKRRKKSHKRHRKRTKRSKRRHDTPSASDSSNHSEEEEDDDDEEEKGEEEEEEDDDEEQEEKENDKEESGSEDSKEDSDKESRHKKLKKHRKKHKHYKKLKHKRSKRKAKRKRTKSYSRSQSSSTSQASSRSSSKRRSSSRVKSRSHSRHRSKDSSEDERGNSSEDRSQSRSVSRSSGSERSRSRSRSKHKIKEKTIKPSKKRSRESSTHKDKKLDKDKSKGKARESRDRSRSKSKRRAESEDQADKNCSDSSSQKISIPMPVDPSKIKQEKNVLVPDLSRVKIEKEDNILPKLHSRPSKEAERADMNAKERDKSQERSHNGNIKRRQSSTEKPQEGILSTDTKKRLSSMEEKSQEGSQDADGKRRRSSTEEKSKRRKDSTESMPDKTAHRRHSSESKASDGEASTQKRVEERRASTEKHKKAPSTISPPSEMSMFDLVLASTQKPKQKTLTEISIFNTSGDKKSTKTHSTREASSEKASVNEAKKSRSGSHRQESGEKDSSGITPDLESSVNSKNAKSSKPEKNTNSQSSSKHSKSDGKHSHSTSSKPKSSSHHHHSHHTEGTSSHQRSNSSSSRSGSSKHHSGNTTTSTSSSTPTSTTTSTSSSHSSSSKNPSVSITTTSSKNKKSTDITSNKSDKDSSRHSSRRHSSSSNKHHTSSRSSTSSRHSHKEDKDSTVEPDRGKKESEAARSRRSLPQEDSQGETFDDNSSNGGGDSPLPDLSMLDEIPQDDWEQMLSGSNTLNMSQESHDLEDDDDEDGLDRDDPSVMEECMKMFNEFQPGPEDLDNQILPKKGRVAVEEEKEIGKQRVARSSSTGNLIVKKPSGARHQRNHPLQKMIERYQRMKEQLKMKDQQLSDLQGGSSAVSSTSSSRTSIVAASSSTHHMPPAHSSSSLHSPPPHSTGKTKKRIAHVPNVSSLLHAREKIKSLPPPPSSKSTAKTSGAISETIAHTVAKGGKRVAHTPKPGALARPIIQPEFGSLVPQNIRQRYLNALIDECKKFCSEREAFSIAAAEESVCYQRAPSRMVYLNLVVNAVKRLRTDQQAGEAAQELLDKDPLLAEKMCIEEPSSSTKPSTSGSPSSSSSSSVSSSRSSSRSHPTNPNHVQLSHSSVLAAGGIRGSWSIEKTKRASQCSQEMLKGEAFYKHLVKYILTEEQLEDNGYPFPDPDEKGKAIVKKIDTRKKISPSSLERYCDRCSTLFTVDKWGFPKSTAPCVYHWGRAYKRRKYGNFETTYSCCGGEQGSEGCSQAATHVSHNYNPKNLRGYVRTISKDMADSNKEVYALDCEMCYTTEGNELSRVTVIASNGETVYEQLVKPENPILDYNTRFSGVTESDMEDVKTTIRDVQAALLARFSDKTILIGHSLESDCHALKIIHNTVIDTSVVFPHKMGPPYKRALRTLAAEYLKKIIQEDVSGHDSAEDAVTCLHLMQWRVKEDLKGLKT